MKITLLTIYCLFITNTSFAYVDPSAGSAIIAAIIGFFGAIIWNIKKIWYKFKSIFLKKSKDK